MTMATTNKTAVVVLSDPKTGTEEALGRLFNALAAAYDYKQGGDDVAIHFLGAGTRWLAELIKSDHPAFELFAALKDNVAGASCGCAEVFGCDTEVTKSGFDLLRDNDVPGTSGVTSLRTLSEQGYQLLVF